MSKHQKIIRTLRFRNRKYIGVLAKLITTLSSMGADIGDISTVSYGELHNIRDITIIANDEDHLSAIVSAVRKVPNVELEAIIDEVMEIHRGGKLKIEPKKPVETIEDLRKIYTPGVASVCRAIKENIQLAQTHTTIGKTVGLITNGSRVLGLGNLGPVASMPVMEGKAALCNQFSGLHMIPILVDTLDPTLFVSSVLTIAKTFSAIQLEDIQTPSCYAIEEELDKKLKIPVFHDDQHGTATVALAALINASRMAKLDLKKAIIGQVGLGAAGSAIARLIMKYTGGKVLGADLNEEATKRFKKLGGEVSDLKTIMKECQVVIATTGLPGVIKSEFVQKGQIILALSNPFPEIRSDDALKAGAAFATDGSRVNNLLGFPGILKGSVEAKATHFVPEMFVAAAEAIVAQTPVDEVIPDPLNPQVHLAVARSVTKAAIHARVTQDFEI
ncbi:MAG: NAD-dependent malic enzyme [Deltaproteobacteria bacterium]|nr:NAD-dependent malic enzyme [Deltaproteobacteria bacterium]